MFRTHPDAELPVPRTLATGGERVWGWVEMALDIPYFLATVVYSDEGTPVLQRSLLFSDVRAIVELAEISHHEFQLVRVSLLSPGYMNGTGAYQLNQLREIWQDRESGGQSFILADGTRMELRPMSGQGSDQHLKRVFAMPLH